MGVVTALEVCRLNEEQGLDLPLQLISFLEEEGSGFGQMLLGSRIIAQRVTEEDLRERFRSIDDGRSFWEHAADAGYQPERWRECAHVLDDLTGWIEMHIEQARVLQDTGNRIGLVTAIAGYVHADVVVHGRGDHAGATPMDFRLDPTLPLAETILELERLAREAGQGTVGTVGEIEVDPGIINAIAEQVRFSLDIRGPVEDAYKGVARDIAAFAEQAAAARGMRRSTASASRSRRHRWTTASSARWRRPRRRPASRTCACTRAPRTTRCASPTASRPRWSSSPASTESATTRPRTRARPTRRSLPRSS